MTDTRNTEKCNINGNEIVSINHIGRLYSVLTPDSVTNYCNMKTSHTFREGFARMRLKENSGIEIEGQIGLVREEKFGDRA